ncbi:MAG: adenosylcobinamide-GDP ribazoletransferase, partial [Selenomonadaceae bacterium]|nr:adenosylcobinamide-GDP ribazoletransferase [Selenomonadaceae bacterium]
MRSEAQLKEKESSKEREREKTLIIGLVIVVRSFFVALTFLTRISLFTVKDYREDDFKKSVKFFPLVGAVLGGFYAFFSYILSNNGYVHLSQNIVVALMIFFMFFLVGGLFFDGFM